MWSKFVSNIVYVRQVVWCSEREFEFGEYCRLDFSLWESNDEWIRVDREEYERAIAQEMLGWRKSLKTMSA